MGQKATRLCRARPDHDQGLLFARYLDQAAEGFFAILLGRDSERIVAAAFIEPGHSLSHEHVMFAEREGVVVGMSLAYTGAQHRGFSDEPLKRAAGRRALRMKIIRTLFAPMWRILETVPEGDFYLQSIAVEPELRGVGVGSHLLNDAEARARENGSTRLTLDVGAKNKGASKLYSRHGLVECSEWPSPRFVPTVFVRMSKSLQR